MDKCLTLGEPHQKLQLFGRLFLVSYNHHQSKVTISGILCRQLELLQLLVKQNSLNSRNNQYILKLEAVPFAKIIYNNFFYCHSQLETFLLIYNQHHNSLGFLNAPNDFFRGLEAFLLQEDQIKHKSLYNIYCDGPRLSVGHLRYYVMDTCPPEACYASTLFKVQMLPFQEEKQDLNSLFYYRCWVQYRRAL